jgi:energy-converting hydrogenase Eha subunit B
MIDALGWAATAIFLASYSCSDPAKLRLIQATAALVWVGYGAMLDAVPIIAANLLVAAVAAYSAIQGFRRSRQAGPAAGAIRPAAAADLSRTS